MMVDYCTKKKKKKKKCPPGPLGLPLLGNLLQIDKARPQVYLQRLAHKYGPLVSLRLGRARILVVSSSRMAEQILKTHDRSFCSRPAVVGQQRLSYGGLDMAFSPYNHHWRRMRKMCVLHLFSAKRVLSFRAVREDEVRRMITKISTLSNSKSQLAVNLSTMAMSLASNLICRVAFGRRYDDDEYEKIRFDRLIIEAQALMVSFYFKDHFPAPFGVWADKASGLMGRLDKNCQELDAFYEQLINEHLDPNRPNPETDPDIIDLLIQLKQNQGESTDLSWDKIKALLMNLFVAGTDTAAAVIVWTMTGLMQRPKMMKKVQAHIRQTMGSNKGFVHEDDIMKLPYLKAVVLEALRLYPPAPLIFRTQILPNECTVIDGYEIEPGTSVYINAWAMGRDTETWEDPEEFRPERFMSGSNDNTNMVLIKGCRDLDFEMIPFGGGRRGCPGMEMGLISVELALANLLYSFDWALPHHHSTIDTDALPGLTMHKKSPLLLVPTLYM
ncbi:Cytochrome P450 83B1 [Striga hermonthica]|uniref:Cytochrome P450 83B1 n=1 Tax=Striga hermonthica TaxID=68872 RepID=A0A9N7RN93_STRHE|nr:Cytochrome P450 83B1 [Striga hermonthica]